jgi:mono/diheme cytochrome c family protein
MSGLRFLFFCAIVAALCGTGESRAAQPVAAQQLKQFGEKYCFSCHGAEKQKGDFDFRPYAEKGFTPSERKAWEKIAELIESREMPPPEGKVKLPESQRDAIVQWIDGQLTGSESAQKNPGHVTLRRLNRGEYRNTIRDLFAVDFDAADFPSDETAFGFDTIADVLTIQPLLMERYLAAAGQIVSKILASQKKAGKSEPGESFRRVFARMPEPGAEAKTARELIASLAPRVYRRPVAAAEVERLGRLVDAALADKAPFTEAMGVAVQAMLCSPNFLFRWELDPDALKPGSIRNLTDYEVASRLSYFLWSSMPDERLMDLAAKGELLKGDTLRAEVQRMLADSRAQELVRNFSSQWLQIRAVDEVEIDEKKFPKFSTKLRDAMKEETRLFFDAIVREDRSIFDLIETDFTFVNHQLAGHYGLPDVQGNEFQRVKIPPGSPRGGVLSQGSVLLATSMPTRTSPVVRGKWVLEQILGTPPPPPPANVPPLEETKVDKDASLRVRLEQHRDNPDCAVCHAKIDPVGFTLENFDAIGAWRTQDGNSPINTSEKFADGTRVDGFAGLKKYLKGEKFARAFAQKMMTYAIGRGIERTDKQALDAVQKQTTAGGYKMSALISAIVTSDPFLKRKRDTAAR